MINPNRVQLPRGLLNELAAMGNEHHTFAARNRLSDEYGGDDSLPAAGGGDHANSAAAAPNLRVDAVDYLPLIGS